MLRYYCRYQLCYSPLPVLLPIMWPAGLLSQSMCVRLHPIQMLIGCRMSGHGEMEYIYMLMAIMSGQDLTMFMFVDIGVREGVATPGTEGTGGRFSYLSYQQKKACRIVRQAFFCL